MNIELNNDNADNEEPQLDPQQQVRDQEATNDQVVTNVEAPEHKKIGFTAIEKFLIIVWCQEEINPLFTLKKWNLPVSHRRLKRDWRGRSCL